MTSRALAFLLLLICAGPGLAQTVAVRSGEHADFSRLVFETPADAGWSLGRGADGYVLRFDDPGYDVRLGGVFEMIPRTRLRAVATADPGTVALNVAEGVHADAFVLRPGILVLDIKDGPPPPDSRFERPLIAPGPEPVALPEPDPQPAPPPRPRVRLPIEVGRAPPAQIIGDFLPPEPQIRTEDPRVAAVRDSLLKQIGRAASQGLLEPAEALPRPESHEDPHEEPAPDDHAEGEQGHDMAHADEPPDDPAPADQSDRPNMRIETSIDRGVGGQSGVPPQSAEGTTCYSDSYFEFAALGQETTPAELIARTRGALLNIRDAAGPEGAEDLVQAYLAFGFGAEARAVINELELATPRTRIWREIATMFDTGHATRPDLFDGQLSCPSRAALWAALAYPEFPDNATVDDAAVIRSFSELPVHLRRHLGPMLAERFLAADNTEAADRVRNAVARAGDEARTDDLTLAEARIDLTRGETRSAERRIDDVVSEGGLETPDALALRIETELSQDKVPSLDAMALAEALAFERRGTPIGGRLLSLAIRGYAARGNFSTAFGMLAHHDLTGNKALASEVVQKLAEIGSDADLVREAYSGLLAKRDVALRPDARLMVADRLLRLGFAPRAAEIVEGLPPQGTTIERRVRARLALAENQPEQALQYLAGLEGPETEILRAEVARAQGDLAAAARHYEAAGETGRQAALAWRMRDWSTVEAAGPEAQRDYAAERDETPAAEFSADGEPSLSGARALLDGSDKMRGRLEKLLAPAQSDP